MRRRELLGGVARGIAGLWLARILPARAEVPTTRRERGLHNTVTHVVYLDGSVLDMPPASFAELAELRAGPYNCQCVLTIPWYIASDKERQFLAEVRNA